MKNPKNFMWTLLLLLLCAPVVTSFKPNEKPPFFEKPAPKIVLPTIQSVFAKYPQGLKWYGKSLNNCDVLEYINNIGAEPMPVNGLYEASDNLVDTLPAQFQSTFGVFHYTHYPYLALLDRNLIASEQAFQQMAAQLEGMCGTPFFFLIGKQVDPKSNQLTVEYRTMLRLPRTAEFANMNSTLEEAINNLVKAEITSKAGGSGFGTDRDMDAETAGVRKLRELIVKFLNGTLNTNMSEDLLRMNNFYEVEGGLPITDIVNTSAVHHTNSVIDYAGLEYQGQSIFPDVEDVATDGYGYGLSQVGYVGIVMTDNQNYTSGHFEKANAAFNDTMTQKIVMWLHYFESASGAKKIFYKWRLKNFTKQDASAVLAAAYTNYIEPPVAKPGAEETQTENKSVCPPGLLTLSETWRTKPAITTCLENMGAGQINKYFPASLGMALVEQAKYNGGIACGFVDGILDSFQFFYEIARGLANLYIHTPLTRGWFIHAMKKIVEEGSFWEGLKEKAKDDGKYWLGVWDTIQNVGKLLSEASLTSMFHAIMDMLKDWFRETLTFVKGTVIAGYNVGKLAAEIVLDIITGGASLSGSLGKAVVSRFDNMAAVFRKGPWEIKDHLKGYYHQSKNFVAKAKCKILGTGCFVAGTLVATSNSAMPIDQILENQAVAELKNAAANDPANEFVLAYQFAKLPEAEVNRNTWTEIDYEEITPETWKWLDLEMVENSGDTMILKLRRPNWWIEQNDAGEVGCWVGISLPEMNISGLAQVKKVYPSRADTRTFVRKTEGNEVYRPITGWFKRKAPEVWDYVFSSKDTIGSTPNHPFFSVARQDFVAVGELDLGENVALAGGKTAALVSKVPRQLGCEWVFNLEVWRDHDFFVGDGKLLAHNNYGIAQNLIAGIHNATKAFHQPYKCKEYSKALRSYFKKKGVNVKTIRRQLTRNGKDEAFVIGFDMPNGTSINIATNGFHEFTIINDKIFDNNIFDGMPSSEFLDRMVIPEGYRFREIDIID